MSRHVLCAAVFTVATACYWNDKCTYTYFGSKTVYDDVRGDVRDVPKLKGCEPSSVWALMRHGTRQPSSSNLPNIFNAARFKDLIVRSHREGQGELCAQDIENLQDWMWYEVGESTAGYLTEAGYQELFKLGTRFHEYFRPLLQELDHFYFRPTLEQRTIESSKAFVEGLGQGIFQFEQSNATDIDDVLRFKNIKEMEAALKSYFGAVSKYRLNWRICLNPPKNEPYYYCAKHNLEVYHGPRSKMEIRNYHKTLEFQMLIDNVRNRAGLQEPLSSTNVTGLYDLCRYFRAYSSTRTSPWCALFTDQDLEALEYVNDLRHYYRNAYGSPINLKLGRQTLKDLFENFRSSVEESTKSFTGYFSHDSMLQMTYSALGLFRDDSQITGLDRIPMRRWRTSIITPFAANFVAILHKCSPENSTSSYQVQFLINEVEVELCGARTCTWDQFVDKFQPFLDSNLDFCRLNSNDTSPPKNIKARTVVYSTDVKDM